IDADTKQPVDGFRIVYGIRWPGQEDVTWQTAMRGKIESGSYEVTSGDFSNGGKLRIEADGYVPNSSRLIMASDGAIKVDFELKKGSGPSGIVLDDKDQPVAGVNVYFIGSEGYFYINEGQESLTL